MELNFAFGKEHVASEVKRQVEKTTVNTSTVEINNNQLEDLKSELEELLNSMITISDNESYNELVRMHGNDRSFVDGCEYIENYILESGYENTGIFHTLSPSNTESQSTSDIKNYTSVEDCGKLLEKIYNGTCVSESASQEMLQLLLEQQVVNKIPSVLPEGVETANKTGETDEVQHDAAIVYGEQTDYIICIMTTGFSDADSAVSVIQNVSQTVYYYLNSDTDEE